MLSFKSKSFQEYRSSPDQNDLLNSVINFHPYAHCIEIITNNPSPPAFPPPKMQNTSFFHVLLDIKALKDESIVNDLFTPSTRFISLSPITTGNGLFIQKSTITFILNEATYQRFGLSGKKLGNDSNQHIISIKSDQVQLLQRIRPCEPIVGLLSTQNPDIYKRYLKKVSPMDLSIDVWQPTSEFQFDINSLNNPETLSTDWIFEFKKAIDVSLLQRKKIAMTSSIQRITIEGFFNLSDFDEWIRSIGQNGWAIAMVWDMKDIPGSFLGKKKTFTGCGGGCDLILFGKNLSHAHQIQTVQYIDEE